MASMAGWGMCLGDAFRIMRDIARIPYRWGLNTIIRYLFPTFFDTCFTQITTVIKGTILTRATRTTPYGWGLNTTIRYRCSTFLDTCSTQITTVIKGRRRSNTTRTTPYRWGLNTTPYRWGSNTTWLTRDIC